MVDAARGQFLDVGFDGDRAGRFDAFFRRFRVIRSARPVLEVVVVGRPFGVEHRVQGRAGGADVGRVGFGERAERHGGSLLATERVGRDEADRVQSVRLEFDHGGGLSGGARSLPGFARGSAAFAGAFRPQFVDEVVLCGRVGAQRRQLAVERGRGRFDRAGGVGARGGDGREGLDRAVARARGVGRDCLVVERRAGRQGVRVSGPTGLSP